MVRLILQRAVYAGEGAWRGIRLTVTPILDEGVWESAQRRRRRVRTLGASAAVNLLSGLLYCGLCQSRMQGDTTRVRKGQAVYEYRTYICSRWHAGRGCVSNRHDAADLEARVIAGLRAETSTIPTARDERASLQADLAAVDAAMARNARRRQNVIDEIADGVMSGATAREAVERMEREREALTAEQQRLATALEDAEQRVTLAASRPAAVALLDGLAAVAQKSLLQAYIRTIVVRPGDPEPHIVE